MMSDTQRSVEDIEESDPEAWGEDSLLRIEEDLDDLEETGEPGKDGGGSVRMPDDRETDLDEWEELIDSQWVKLID